MGFIARQYIKPIKSAALPACCKSRSSRLFKKPAGKAQEKVNADQNAGQRFGATPQELAAEPAPRTGADQAYLTYAKAWLFCGSTASGSYSTGFPRGSARMISHICLLSESGFIAMILIPLTLLPIISFSRDVFSSVSPISVPSRMIPERRSRAYSWRPIESYDG